MILSPKVCKIQSLIFFICQILKNTNIILHRSKDKKIIEKIIKEGKGIGEILKMSLEILMKKKW